MALCCRPPKSSSPLLLGPDLDIGDAGPVQRLHHVTGGGELDTSVALQKDGLVRVPPALLGDRLSQPLQRHAIAAQVDLAEVRNGHDDVAVVVVALVVVLRDGQIDVDALAQHGRDDHEDDEQDQHDVDQRRDIDVGLQLTRRASPRVRAATRAPPPSPARARGRRARAPAGRRSGPQPGDDHDVLALRFDRPSLMTTSTSSDAVSSMSTVSCSMRALKKLKNQTAMMATPSPTAVVTSASAMPADTVPMPPPPLAGSANF